MGWPSSKCAPSRAAEGQRDSAPAPAAAGPSPSGCRRTRRPGAGRSVLSSMRRWTRRAGVRRPWPAAGLVCCATRRGHCAPNASLISRVIARKRSTSAARSCSAAARRVPPHQAQERLQKMRFRSKGSSRPARTRSPRASRIRAPRRRSSRRSKPMPTIRSRFSGRRDPGIR